MDQSHNTLDSPVNPIMSTLLPSACPPGALARARLSTADVAKAQYSVGEADPAVVIKSFYCDGF